MTDLRRRSEMMRSKGWEFRLYCSLALLCLVILFTPIALAQDDHLGKIVEESIISNQKKRNYYLFVPATVKPSTPLTVLLHASAHNALSLVAPWTDSANKEVS